MLLDLRGTWRRFVFRSRVTAPIPSTEPKNFAAGETVEWTKSFADYASTDGWSLVYSIRGPSVFPDVTAVSNPDGSYSVTITAASTGNLIAGTYAWAAHAYKAGPPILRYPVGRGIIYVTPNLGTTEILTTHASRMLAAIEAVLEGRVPKDVQQYTIGGRQLTKIDISELYALRSKYRAEVAKERSPNRSNPTRKVTFVNP